MGKMVRKKMQSLIFQALQNRKTIIKRAIVIFLFTFCFLVPCLSVINKSVVFDEPFHFYSGLKFLLGTPMPANVSFSYSPPLEAIFALPQLFLKVDFVKDINYLYDYIFLSRAITALCSLILSFFVYRWSCELHGKNAGIFALTLYAFCPNILANAGIVTIDLLVTCFAFIWFYYLWRIYNHYSFRNIALCGFFFGLALISKHTSLTFIPVYLIIGLLLFLESTSKEKKAFLFRFIKSSAIILFIGWLIVNASYRFQLYSFSIGRLYKYFPALSTQKIFTDIILPFPSLYLKNLNFKLTEASGGWFGNFLMGQYSVKGWLYYYLIAFLIKTPIPMLIFLILAIWITFKNSTKRSRLGEYFLWVPPLFIFLIASFQHCQIGIRHILTVYPFIFVFISKFVSGAFIKKKFFPPVFITLMAWLIFSVVQIFPHYLAYFNELVGGPDNGYKYLVDSNLDWGQDLPGLKKYMTDNNIDNIKLCYFGNAKPEDYGIDYEPLPSGQEPASFSSLPKGDIAISATYLQGAYFVDRTRYHWLKKYQPVAKIGYSIFLYDIK